MNDKIENAELLRFLKLLGYKDNKIDEMTLETRIMHDLGCDGDSFDEVMEVLLDEFEVSFSGMTWEKWEEYRPSEGKLLSLIEDMRRLFNWLKGEPKKEYIPVTLAMIADAIRLKKWPYG